MTRKSLLIAPLVLGTAALGAAPVLAQDWDAGIKVEVPFAFTVGHKTLSSGTYMIRRISGLEEDAFMISSRQSKDEALFMATESTNPNQERRHDEVIFNRVGDRYFLSKVDSSGGGTELALPEPKSEKRLIARAETVGMNEVTVPALIGE